MGYFRQNLRSLAWLACLAILLNALMPTIAHAVAASQDEPALWGVICSASGTKFVPAPFDLPADKKSDTGSMMAHCPYCLMHAGSAGPLPQAPSMPIAPALKHVMPELFYLAPYPLFAWATAQPRAPPALV